MSDFCYNWNWPLCLLYTLNLSWCVVAIVTFLGSYYRLTVMKKLLQFHEFFDGRMPKKKKTKNIKSQLGISKNSR